MTCRRRKNSWRRSAQKRTRSDSVKKLNWYYMTQRPPMPGAFPRGIIEINEFYPTREILGVSDHVYAEIGYERELTEQEIHDYELVPRVI